MKKLANISGRQYDLLDVLIIGVDQGLSVLFGPRASAIRPSPGDEVEPDYPLDKEEQRLSAALMRVNHTSEVSSQALYKGQALVARDPEYRSLMKLAAIEDGDHLDWCEQRLGELAGHRSYLNPVWYLGSFAIGGIAGFLGDHWSHGFIAETEQQAGERLQDQLRRLPGKDVKSRAIITQMQADEGQHADVAAGAGTAAIPVTVRKVMQAAYRLMTTTAYWV